LKEFVNNKVYVSANVGNILESTVAYEKAILTNTSRTALSAKIGSKTDLYDDMLSFSMTSSVNYTGRF